MTTTITTLDNLVDALVKLETLSGSLRQQDPYSKYIDGDKVPTDLWEDIQTLTDHHLIKDDGTPNRLSITHLRSMGYPVYPGETDSFGWLSGCIDTKKGTIVFG